MPRPYGLMFEQGTTGRYNRLAGLGASQDSGINLNDIYPVNASGLQQWMSSGQAVPNYAAAMGQPTTIGSSLSSLWPWLAGGLVVGVLLFRR